MRLFALDGWCITVRSQDVRFESCLSFFRQIGQNVNFSRFEPKEFIATGDKVVAPGHYTATTPVGKSFDSDFAMVFTLRNGKVTAFQEFTDSAAVNAAYAVGATV
jgi:uncharacterized protein